MRSLAIDPLVKFDPPVAQSIARITVSLDTIVVADTGAEAQEMRSERPKKFFHKFYPFIGISFAVENPVKIGVVALMKFENQRILYVVKR